MHDEDDRAGRLREIAEIRARIGTDIPRAEQTAHRITSSEEQARAIAAIAEAAYASSDAERLAYQISNEYWKASLPGKVATAVARTDLALQVLAVRGGVPMTATIPSTALVPVQPAFTDAARLALAGYLAGYRGLTREAYTLDLRQFTGWCRARSLPLFSVRRADIETFAREMEASGRARATVTRRLSPSPGSTGTPSRRNSSTTRPPHTSAVRG
jgi:Phage integrase, N-terminal SAM-like domain